MDLGRLQDRRERHGVDGTLDHSHRVVVVVEDRPTRLVHAVPVAECVELLLVEEHGGGPVGVRRLEPEAGQLRRVRDDQLHVPVRRREEDRRFGLRPGELGESLDEATRRVRAPRPQGRAPGPQAGRQVIGDAENTVAGRRKLPHGIETGRRQAKDDR